jgi:hypothetical protein
MRFEHHYTMPDRKGQSVAIRSQNRLRKTKFSHMPFGIYSAARVASNQRPSPYKRCTGGQHVVRWKV